MGACGCKAVLPDEPWLQTVGRESDASPQSAMSSPGSAQANIAFSEVARLIDLRRSATPRPAVPRRRRFDGDSDDIALYLTRNVNKNLVVYEAQWAGDSRTELHPTNPLRVYWLSVDPEYRRRRAARGVAGDKVEFNYLEHKAFGVRCVRTDDDPVHGAVWNVTFIAAAKLTSRVLRLYRDAHTGRPVMTTSMCASTGVVCEACVDHFDAYVEKSFAAWTVRTVDMIGTNLVNGVQVAERIKGSGSPGGPQGNSPLSPDSPRGPAFYQTPSPSMSAVSSPRAVVSSPRSTPVSPRVSRRARVHSKSSSGSVARMSTSPAEPTTQRVGN